MNRCITSLFCVLLRLKYRTAASRNFLLESSTLARVTLYRSCRDHSCMDVSMTFKRLNDRMHSHKHLSFKRLEHTHRHMDITSLTLMECIRGEARFINISASAPCPSCHIHIHKEPSNQPHPYERCFYDTTLVKQPEPHLEKGLSTSNINVHLSRWIDEIATNTNKAKTETFFWIHHMYKGIYDLCLHSYLVCIAIDSLHTVQVES